MQTPTFLTKLSDESIIFIIDVGKSPFFNYSPMDQLMSRATVILL
jgi:hypothetical protein